MTLSEVELKAKNNIADIYLTALTVRVN